MHASTTKMMTSITIVVVVVVSLMIVRLLATRSMTGMMWMVLMMICLLLLVVVVAVAVTVTSGGLASHTHVAAHLLNRPLLGLSLITHERNVLLQSRTLPLLQFFPLTEPCLPLGCWVNELWNVRPGNQATDCDNNKVGGTGRVDYRLVYTYITRFGSIRLVGWYR